MHEDQNKVFFHEDTTFYLLFDFNAQVGDTIYAFEPINRTLFSVDLDNQTGIPYSIPYEIESIDVIMIEGIPHNRFETVPLYAVQPTFCVDQKVVIENIGSTSMFFSGEACFYVGKGCYGELVCYRDSSLDYESGFLSCDSFNYSSVTDYSDLDRQLTLFPNPTTSSFQLLNSSNLRIREISVFSSVGVLLWRGNPEDVIHFTPELPGMIQVGIRFQTGEYLVKLLVVQ